MVTYRYKDASYISKSYFNSHSSFWLVQSPVTLSFMVRHNGPDAFESLFTTEIFGNITDSNSVFLNVHLLILGSQVKQPPHKSNKSSQRLSSWRFIFAQKCPVVSIVFVNSLIVIFKLTHCPLTQTSLLVHLKPKHSVADVCLVYIVSTSLFIYILIKNVPHFIYIYIYTDLLVIWAHIIHFRNRKGYLDI